VILDRRAAVMSSRGAARQLRAKNHLSQVSGAVSMYGRLLTLADARWRHNNRSVEVAKSGEWAPARPAQRNGDGAPHGVIHAQHRDIMTGSATMKLLFR